MELPKRVPNGLRVLDTFCCAGGMGMGYWLAGFDVVGIDINPQPNYPFPFIQGDAIEYIRKHGHEYDLIHGSPPCQHYTPLNAYNHKTYPDLIGPTREAMISTGKPYVIENVEAAWPELKDPITLCGPMFDLKIYRHRLFESSFPIRERMHSKHIFTCARNGYLPTPSIPFMTITGGRHSRAWQNAATDAMEMPWIKVPNGGNIKLGIREVCEAIPPKYAEWIGSQFMRYANESP